MGLTLYDEVNHFSQATGLAFRLHQVIALRCDNDTRRTKFPISTPQLLRETDKKSKTHLSEAQHKLRALGYVTSSREGVRGMNHFYCHTLQSSRGGTLEPKTAKTPVPVGAPSVPVGALSVPVGAPFRREETKREEEHPADAGMPPPPQPTAEEEAESEPTPQSTPNDGTEPPVPKKQRDRGRLRTSTEWWQADELREDAAFLRALKLRPEYQGLEIDAELKGIAAYCQKTGKSMTRGFIVNCLKRCEKPMQFTSTITDLAGAQREFDGAVKKVTPYYAGFAESLSKKFAEAYHAQDLVTCCDLVMEARKLSEKRAPL